MTSSQTVWSFGEPWPYETKWFDTRIGKIQYLDEGSRDGIPIIFVHGNATWSSRTGILAFPRQVPSSPKGPISDFADREGIALSNAFRDRPVKTVWPMKDVTLLPETPEDMGSPIFADAEIVYVQSSGHFIQEDAHTPVSPELMDFIGRDVCRQKGVS